MSGVVPCGKAGRQAGMTNLIIAFRHYANLPKNSVSTSSRIYSLFDV
jgi:hypothetical protein